MIACEQDSGSCPKGLMHTGFGFRYLERRIPRWARGSKTSAGETQPMGQTNTPARQERRVGCRSQQSHSSGPLGCKVRRRYLNGCESLPDCQQARVRQRSGGPKPKRVPSVALNQKLLTFRGFLLRIHELPKNSDCPNEDATRMRQLTSLTSSTASNHSANKHSIRKNHKYLLLLLLQNPRRRRAQAARQRSTSRETSPEKERKAGKSPATAREKEGKPVKAKMVCSDGSTTKRDSQEIRHGAQRPYLRKRTKAGEDQRCRRKKVVRQKRGRADIGRHLVQ